jgi:hypothetical protein
MILDSGISSRKSRHVRSWYLYEQYKSLERNQLDAAQKLRDRSNQENILRQELHERRVRRKLYDECELACRSDSQIQKSISDAKSLSNSSEDFFESFCELHNNDSSPDSEVSDSEDVYSQDDSHSPVEFKSLDNMKDDQSYAESINSVIENYKSNEDLEGTINQKLTLVEKSIAEEISLRLETYKENIECLEKITRLYKDSSLASVEEPPKKISAGHNTNECDVTVFNIWSKLVSFAYQVIQLNHGKHYLDSLKLKDLNTILILIRFHFGLRDHCFTSQLIKLLCFITHTLMFRNL